MSKIFFLIPVFVGLMAFGAAAQENFQSDVLKTSLGDLEITFIGHGTLMFEFDGMVIHVDPVSRYADYSKMPKADVVLVTHEHGDHLDKGTIDRIATDDTVVVLTEACKQRGQSGTGMKNGDVKSVKGLKIEAVPATTSYTCAKRGNRFIRRAPAMAT